MQVRVDYQHQVLPSGPGLCLTHHRSCGVLTSVPSASWVGPSARGMQATGGQEPTGHIFLSLPWKSVLTRWTSETWKEPSGTQSANVAAIFSVPSISFRLLSSSPSPPMTWEYYSCSRVQETNSGELAPAELESPSLELPCWFSALQCPRMRRRSLTMTPRGQEEQLAHHRALPWPPSSRGGPLCPSSPSSIKQGTFASRPDSPRFPVGGCSRICPDGGPGK